MDLQGNTQPTKVVSLGLAYARNRIEAMVGWPSGKQERKRLGIGGLDMS